jgi:hypothetical protein
MRYAIDKKPTYYKTVRYSEDNENELLENSYVYDVKDGWDWRELIYQMALDYRKNYHKDNFLYDLAKNNSDYYATGKTGYE